VIDNVPTKQRESVAGGLVADRAATDGLLHFGTRRRLPLIRQSEAAECGLACLAMVSGYFQHHLTLSEMRHRFTSSLKGMKLERMLEIAREMGLNGRPVKLELSELGQLDTPAILHWDMNHFVVLRSVNERRLIIHDPAVGERRIPIPEASKHFTGIAVEVTRGPDFRRKRAEPPVAMRDIVGSVQGLGRSLAVVFALAAVLELFSLLAPQFLEIVVDQVLADSDLDLLTFLGFSFSFLLLLQVIVGAARTWTITWVTSQFSLKWTGNVFQHLLRLPQGWFLRRHLGDIVSRFGVIANIQKTLTTRFVEVVMDGIMAIATGILLLIYSPLLTAVIVGALGLYTLSRLLYYRVYREANLGQIVINAKQQSQFMESARGVQTIRLFNKESVRSSNYMNVTAESLNAGIVVQRLSMIFSSFSTITSGIQKVGVLWLGAWMAIKGNFSAGMLMAFAAYGDQFATRASSLVDYIIELRLLRMQGERLADIVLTPAEPSGHGAYAGPDPAPSIVAERLAFRYAAGEPWIIKDVSFEVAAGESVVVVGPSGCGKSTLIRILVGLLDPNQGRIEIGGVDLKHLGKARLRQMTSTVMQDDRLFSGTIADNISFFDEDASPQRVEDAARQAEIYDDIVKMPMGFHTLVGDMGSSLSGGQQQRMFLARAFYCHPRILIMDEATSHLDPELERRIAETLRQSGTTRIFISHRPEVIATADRVIHLTTPKR
jgi:ATP-binding cassette subfamily B protein RaxB